MEFFNENIGVYPYKQYSVVQGGDGGMEYSMLTLLTMVMICSTCKCNFS